MRPASEKRRELRSSASGPGGYVYVQRFEVEQSDVDTVRPHYLGYCYKAHRFKSDDVGRAIEVLTDGGWTVWNFCQEK